MKNYDIPPQNVVWDKISEIRKAIKTPSKLAKRVLARLQLKNPSIKIIDLGCGVGADLLYFAKHKLTVVGSDFSTHALRISARKLEENNQRSSLVQADFSNCLPFENHSFDVVFSNLALHYFDKITTVQLFNEVNRILVPGGMFWGSVKSIDDYKYGKGIQIDECRFLNNGQLSKRFTHDELVLCLKEFDNITVQADRMYYDQSRKLSHVLSFFAQKHEA